MLCHAFSFVISQRRLSKNPLARKVAVTRRTRCEQQIRQLMLKAGRSRDRLTRELNVVHPDSAPPHEAISHVWTDQRSSMSCSSPVQFLMCSNNWFDDQIRYLWLDRVCIDQSCGEERTAHIKIMHRTYRDAAKVIIWLGL
ncbi:hypothetical protein EJ03DRAFT_272236 [Teratosphaeria nubilosa]|uniref:Heterokaryon incompatibility domain-containing protein n=1 Tax=Teratosphaeria nubilosa TaxID=161662 RepID=A0A6G1LAP0_9PEZI|nr:hypothetical protein EJ03DRAFT_272236 [Teratosphaeria nubilosa]